MTGPPRRSPGRRIRGPTPRSEALLTGPGSGRIPSLARGARAGLLAAAVALVAACDRAPKSPPSGGGGELEALFRVGGLERPYGVAWDSLRRRWLVTNAAGGEEGSAEGFLTAVSRRGDSVTPRAYDSTTPGLRLDAPRGIAVRGDRAYVADLHRLVAVDLADGHAAFSLRIPESGRLEDVAVDRRGVIYLSDVRTDAVFRVAPDGSGWERIPAAGSLRRPRGLLVEPGEHDRGDRLLVAGREGAVIALNPDSSVTLVAGSAGFQSLYGIQRSPEGQLVVSDPSAGRLQLLRATSRRVRQPGAAWLGGLDRPADFLIRGRIVAVPETGAGRVSFYRLAE